MLFTQLLLSTLEPLVHKFSSRCESALHAWKGQMKSVEVLLGFFEFPVHFKVEERKKGRI